MEKHEASFSASNPPATRRPQPLSPAADASSRTWSPRRWIFIASTVAWCRNSPRANICARSFRWCAKQWSKRAWRFLPSTPSPLRGAGGTGRRASGWRDVWQSLALALGKPLIAVNHLEGHVHAVLLEAHAAGRRPQLPAVCLIVSGGHTIIYRVKSECTNGAARFPTRASAARATTPPAKPTTKLRACSRSAIPAAP